MPHPISALGAGHTLVSLVTFAAGLYSFARYQKIDSATRSARIYVAGMVISVFTSFGLSSTGGFNAGHALGILALIATSGGPSCRASKRWGVHGGTWLFAFSFSFFLLLVPGSTRR